MKQEEKQKKFNQYYKEVGPYISLGMQLAVTVIAAFFLGRWIDSKTGKEPMWTLIISSVGFILGMYNFIKTVLNVDKDKKK